MLGKILNLTAIYTLATVLAAGLGFFFPIFFLFSLILTFAGILILVARFMENQIDLLFYGTLEDFGELSSGGFSDNWDIEYPDIVLEKDKKAIKSNLEIQTHGLRFETYKRSVGIEDEHAWEGAEIVSQDSHFNAVIAKMMLDLDETKSEKANIYIKGTGQIGKYEYYLGIGSSGPDIFFHIVDLDDDDTVYEDRGRLHLKDYLGEDLDWIFLGMEWGFDGPKIFAYEEGERDFNKFPMNPPPEIRKDIMEDSKMINLYGLSKFAVRTDLNVEGEQFQKVAGDLQTIKVKYGYLSILQ